MLVPVELLNFPQNSQNSAIVLPAHKQRVAWYVNAAKSIGLSTYVGASNILSNYHRCHIGIP